MLSVPSKNILKSELLPKAALLLSVNFKVPSLASNKILELVVPVLNRTSPSVSKPPFACIVDEANKVPVTDIPPVRVSNFLLP